MSPLCEPIWICCEARQFKFLRRGNAGGNSHIGGMWRGRQANTGEGNLFLFLEWQFTGLGKFRASHF